MAEDLRYQIAHLVIILILLLLYQARVLKNQTNKQKGEIKKKEHINHIDHVPSYVRLCGHVETTCKSGFSQDVKRRNTRQTRRDT